MTTRVSQPIYLPDKKSYPYSIMSETNKPDKKLFQFDQYPVWLRLILFFVIWLFITYGYLYLWSAKQTDDLSYTEFKAKVTGGEVAEVELKGQEVTGTYRENDRGENARAQFFKTVLPPFDDPELMSLLENHRVAVRAVSSERSWLFTMLIVMLPWLLIISLFVVMNRKISEQMGTGGPFGFAKSKARRAQPEEIKVTFKDVAGLENVKSELEEMVDYLKSPEKYRLLGAELPKGVLLAGPPGTGKTLMARAMAGEAGVPYYSISGSEFIEMFVGVGASRVRDMFKTAKETAPSLIFIDELDSIGRVRGTGIGGGHDEREQTLNQILSEIDGFSPNESVIVLGATNRPDVLDPALIRPGRFDRQITLDMPQRKARGEILAVHAKKLAMAEDVDLDLVARATVGFSGADLKNLVNEAALLAARKGKRQVETEDFHESRDKIIMGVKREEQLSEEEKRMVAYHEVGHAMIALMLPGTDPLNKVTIIPRGRSLGATEQVPKEDRHNYGKTYLMNRIAVMVGGRAAEQVVFGEITSGAGDDLKKATQLARRMVCQWGMSEKLGLMVFRRGEPHPFLGRELTEEKDYGEATAELIDAEGKAILEGAYEKAKRILTENREKLDLLTRELIDRETLTLAQIQELIPLGGEDGS